jgi:DnaJ-class molecular chaperone
METIVICIQCKGHGITAGYRPYVGQTYKYYEEVCNCCMGSGRQKRTEHQTVKLEPYRPPEAK